MADISKIKPLGYNEAFDIKDNLAIANITRSGTTFTATRRDGTTFTFTQQDNNSDTKLRVYRQNTGYNSDYPLLVSRTTASNIGTSGTNDSYSDIYGVMWNDTTKVPVLNPSTGTVTIPQVLQNGKVANNVLYYQRSSTPTEIIIKTKIKFVSSSIMPTLIIRGYAYGKETPFEFQICFYIYSNEFCNYGVSVTGSWRPSLYLFKYTENSIDYVAVGIKGSVYFPGFSVDVTGGSMGTPAATGNIVVTGWSVVDNASDTSTILIPEVGTDKCRMIGYRYPISNLTLKIKSGTTEGTDLYTFNGSTAKTLDIKQGTGITLTAAAGSLTIANAGVTGVKGNAESSYRTGNVNITPANIHGTGATSQFWRGDNGWSNIAAGAHSKSLSTFVATAGSDDAWNKAGNYNFAISNSNNMMVFNIGGTGNDRNAYIQVGHNNSATYGNITGNLYLNKLGGQVYINSNYAAKVTSATSGQVMVADGTTGGIKTTGYTIATSVPSGAVFTDTTYSIATGDNNGQIKVTPSSGSAYNVNVKGLGTAAYTATTNYPIRSTYTIPAAKGVRITYPTYAPVLISVQRSNSGGRLILIGGGYGAGGTTRNDFTELVSSAESLFTWSLPQSDSISTSVEIMNNPTEGDATVEVWSKSTCTFTQITTLTTAKQNRKLLTSANYTDYTVTKTGTGASGTWGINITGSAGSVAWANVSGKPSTTLATDTGTSTITLAHGGKYKLTAAGSSVIFTMPTDNNTDTKVKQSKSTSSNWRKVLLHYTEDTNATDATTTQTQEVYGADGVSVQPSTGTLRATTFQGHLQNGYAYPNGKSDKPFFEVMTLTQSSTVQINTSTTVLLSNFYGNHDRGILTLRVRSEANSTSPAWIAAEWLSKTDLYNPNNFIITWKHDATNNIYTIKLYIKLTGWSAYNVTKLSEHSWGSQTNSWVYHSVMYGNATYNVAAIPEGETQIISTLSTISNSTSGNAATATKLASTPNNTTTFLRGDNTWSNTLTGNLTLSNNSALIITGATSSGDSWIKFTDADKTVFLGMRRPLASYGPTYYDGSAYHTLVRLTSTIASGQALIADGTNGNVVGRGIRNNTSAGALGWTANATDVTLVTTNTIAYWNGAYTSTTSNLRYSANGEIMGLSTAQTVSATKTFSAIQKFTSTADSAHSTDTTAAVSISGGLSVAKKVSAKEVRIDNGQTSKGVSLQYDASLEVLNFVFS